MYLTPSQGNKYPKHNESIKRTRRADAVLKIVLQLLRLAASHGACSEALCGQAAVRSINIEQINVGQPRAVFRHQFTAAMRNGRPIFMSNTICLVAYSGFLNKALYLSAVSILKRKTAYIVTTVI